MKLTKNLSMLLMGIWFLLHGLLVLVPALAFAGSGNVLALLAIVVGVLCLIER